MIFHPFPSPLSNVVSSVGATTPTTNVIRRQKMPNKPGDLTVTIGDRQVTANDLVEFVNKGKSAQKAVDEIVEDHKQRIDEQKNKLSLRVDVQYSGKASDKDVKSFLSSQWSEMARRGQFSIHDDKGKEVGSIDKVSVK
jgi:hypothetical protein